MNTNRSNYQVNTILAKGHELSCDQYETGLNANTIVMGPSGSGKTRDFLKPNLLQMGSSFVVLDTKGSLEREVGPVLKDHGYEIWHLDFADNLKGNVGYDPIRFLKYDKPSEDGMSYPNELSALQIATSIFPQNRGAKNDPFWDEAARRLIAALILLAGETQPKGCASFTDVINFFEGMFDGGFEDNWTSRFVKNHQSKHPKSRAVAMWNRAISVGSAERTWACIVAFVENALQIFATSDAMDMYERRNQIDFSQLAKKHVAMFVSVSDIDPSLCPLTSTFIMQTIEQLELYADRECGGSLPVPVRFLLDDFSNLTIPNIDKVLSVSRSREMWFTLLFQSIEQLTANYGEPKMMSIVSNCDTQLLLGFCDTVTANFYSLRANKPASTLLNSALTDVWLFIRGRNPERVDRFDLEDHPLYKELPEAQPEVKKAA